MRNLNLPGHLGEPLGPEKSSFALKQWLPLRPNECVWLLMPPTPMQTWVSALLLQRAEISVTQLHPSLAPRRPRGEGVMGAPGAGISIGPILTPCLPRSLAPQPLRPSCPPAPPQRPSRHCRCPRCVSVPPSPTMGGGKPTVSACSAPGLTAPPREKDDPHLGCRISSQCQLCDSRRQSEGCHRVPLM